MILIYLLNKLIFSLILFNLFKYQLFEKLSIFPSIPSQYSSMNDYSQLFKIHIVIIVSEQEICTMKRKPSNQQFVGQYIIKENSHKRRSPNIKKAKSKSKLEQISLAAISKGKICRSREEYSKQDCKGDSSNTTANCTYTRSRLNKLTKKCKEKEDMKDKKQQNKMNQSEIMSIINNFAIKIQRQWRTYKLRQNFKKFISDLKQTRRRSTGVKRISGGGNHVSKLYFDQNKIKLLNSYLQQQNNEQNVSCYNHQKYQKYSSSINQSRENSGSQQASYRSIKNQTSLLSNQFKPKQYSSNISNEELAFSRQKISQNIKSQQYINAKPQSKIQQQSLSSVSKIQKIDNKKIDSEERRGSFDNYQPKAAWETRRHSTGELEVIAPKRQIKSLHFDKAYDIKIERNLQTKSIKKDDKKCAVISKQKIEASPRSLTRIQSDKNAFNIKFPLDKVLKQCKKALQVTKLNKLLSIQNRYNKNEMTYRTYLEIVNKINQDHSSKLQFFEEREGEIKSNWMDLLNIYKTANPQSNNKYLEDQQNHSLSNIQISMSFDKWDFNSSAKKSLDNHLDFSDNLQQSSKVQSIESVLRQLEQDDEGEEGDKKFKKTKTLHIIDAIAERSKEISEKDVDSFNQGHAHNQQSPLAKDKNDQIIIEDQISIKQENLITPKLQLRKQIIEDKHQMPKQQQIIFQSAIKQPIASQKIEPTSDSQTLLISQIQAISPNDKCYINSDLSNLNTDQKVILKDLLFKDFKQLKESKQLDAIIQQNNIIPVKQQQNKQIQLPISAYQSQQIFLSNKKSQIFGDPIINKFAQLVNEKIVLSNIKLINSIKFMFAKLGDQKKRVKQVNSLINTRFTPVETDINAINTWLLEISHFILDNYQHVVKQNLINVKQPPSEQLLELSRKNITFFRVYQTIPQFIFKDFQFYYIKTLAKSNSIGPQKYDSFSTLLYTFHRSLVDSLNISLMQQLISGKKWMTLPWNAQFRKKRKIQNQHAKICLQKSINMVSNWGEYGLGKLQFQDQIAELQNKQYEQQKINLVCRQQIFQIQIQPQLALSNILLLIGQSIYEQELMQFSIEFSKLKN